MLLTLGCDRSPDSSVTRSRSFNRSWSSTTRTGRRGHEHDLDDSRRTTRVLAGTVETAQTDQGPEATRQSHARRGLSGPRFPEGWSIEVLDKSHPRAKFESGNSEVDQWLKKSALQSQRKHLTTSKVLLDENRKIAGYYSLAFSQIDFSDLPVDLAKKLPRRKLPVSALAWLGAHRLF